MLVHGFLRVDLNWLPWKADVGPAVPSQQGDIRECPGGVCSLFSVVSARWSPVLGSKGGRNGIPRPTCDCAAVPACPIPGGWLWALLLHVIGTVHGTSGCGWGQTRLRVRQGFFCDFPACWTPAQAGWVPANACIVLSLHCWTGKAFSFPGRAAPVPQMGWCDGVW